MRNLLANALKFTETGWVKLRVELPQARRRGAGEGLNSTERLIAFSIIDTGIGIAPEKQKMIFEAFQQAGSGTSRKYGGTGLVLSISREIARALSGTIAVSSTPDSGSTFTLYVPLEYRPTHSLSQHETSNGDHLNQPLRTGRTELRQGQATTVSASNSPIDVAQHARFDNVELSGKKVLIVDDDTRNTFATRVLLEGYRMAVLEADNGVDAVALINQHPDLAIVLMMPEMHGYQTIERIRSSAQNRALPIAAVTAKAFKEDRKRCIDARASDYIAKPVNEDELIRVIHCE
ncbi:MAG: response regulator [Deltaproteobacteria bacterium]|nr:response regulator [Deltaproteobacteria bacterium]